MAGEGLEKNDERVYEKVLDQIGTNGRFQKRFNIVFNCLLIMFGTMTFSNIYISLYEPDHWCKVPGRNSTNYTLDEWKNLTIPRFPDKLTNKLEYSKCEMYSLNRTIVPCQYGWEYEQTYFLRTIVGEENWVCDKTLYITQVLTVLRIADIIGTFILGQIGDIFGRKIVLILVILSLLLGRTLSIFTTHIFPLFLFASFFGSLSFMALFQAPLIIIIEISTEESTSHYNFLQCIFWTAGVTILPIVFWILRDYQWGMLVTTLPLAAFLFFQRYIIESPKWLADKGKIKRSVKELKKIAKVNKTQLTEESVASLTGLTKKSSQVYGAMGLFNSWNMARLSILNISGWVAFGVIYSTLYLNINSLAGNPFLNYLCQALAEFPGQFIGKYSSDYLGRRMTSFLALSGGVLTCLGFIVVVSYGENVYAILALSFLLKISASVSCYAINLATLEMFPTCLRQTGVSVGCTVSNLVALMAPIIIYLGNTYDKRYPYLFMITFAILGVIGGLLGPETLHEKLPETIEEAEVFGKGQKFWVIPKKSKEHELIINKE